jgi:hypothetical protein
VKVPGGAHAYFFSINFCTSVATSAGLS